MHRQEEKLVVGVACVVGWQFLWLSISTTAHQHYSMYKLTSSFHPPIKISSYITFICTCYPVPLLSKGSFVLPARHQSFKLNLMNSYLLSGINLHLGILFSIQESAMISPCFLFPIYLFYTIIFKQLICYMNKCFDILHFQKPADDSE